MTSAADILKDPYNTKPITDASPIMNNAMEVIERVFGDKIVCFYDSALVGPSVWMWGGVCYKSMTIPDAYKAARCIRKMEIRRMNKGE